MQGGARDFLLNFFYPPRCVGCDFWCAWGRRGLWCDVCESLRRDSVDFIKWVDDIPVHAAHSYECAPVAAAIRAIKYGRVRDAAELCGAWTRPLINRAVTEVNNLCVVIPVPLHPQRLAERGFNQAELLARAAINKNAVIDIDKDLLQRTVFTHAQAESSEEERQKQIQDAFSVTPGRRCDPKITYIIFDDVITTGSTIRDCARALRAVGAEKIVGVTIAGT